MPTRYSSCPFSVIQSIGGNMSHPGMRDDQAPMFQRVDHGIKPTSHGQVMCHQSYKPILPRLHQARLRAQPATSTSNDDTSWLSPDHDESHQQGPPTKLSNLAGVPTLKSRAQPFKKHGAGVDGQIKKVITILVDAESLMCDRACGDVLATNFTCTSPTALLD